jgi:hypothetical protein
MTTSPVDPTTYLGQSLAVGRFFRAVDLRDWATVTALLADEIATDYVSLFGGEPEVVTREELVGRWQALLPGFDATQHFLGQLLPTRPGVLEGNVRGFHHLGEQTWMAAGWYVLGVVDAGDGEPVRVSAITLLAAYETGDRALTEEAARRAASV